MVKRINGELLQLVVQTKKTGSGACELATTCVDASENCHRAVFAETMICDPAKRWMYCYSYKQKLGMVFDKDLGVYILPEWKKTLMERVTQ